MSLDAESQSPLQRLRTIVDQRERDRQTRQTSLPALRARTLANTEVLREMTRHSPLVTLPPRAYADVLIAAPDEGFTQAVKDFLLGALPRAAQLYTEVSGVGSQDASSRRGFIVKIRVSLPGMSGSQATAQVRKALSELDWVEADYSESIDLIVVRPPADGTTRDGLTTGAEHPQ